MAGRSTVVGARANNWQRQLIPVLFSSLLSSTKGNTETEEEEVDEPVLPPGLVVSQKAGK